MDVDAAAAALAERLVIDETRDVVHWQGSGGKPEVTGLHDYRALYAVPGLYEAVYLIRLPAAGARHGDPGRLGHGTERLGAGAARAVGRLG